MKVNNQDAEPGCYIQGSHGQYGLDQLGDVCEQFDIEPRDVDTPAFWRKIADAETLDDAMVDMKVWTTENAWEQHVGAADALEEILNDKTEGGHWEWIDGEFFLVQTEVWHWLYVTDTDYDAAWQQVLSASVNEHNGYTDQYQACELNEDAVASGDTDDKVYQFKITIECDLTDDTGEEVTNGLETDTRT